jgi:hypothetical protein
MVVMFPRPPWQIASTTGFRPAPPDQSLAHRSRGGSQGMGQKPGTIGRKLKYANIAPSKQKQPCCTTSQHPLHCHDACEVSVATGMPECAPPDLASMLHSQPCSHTLPTATATAIPATLTQASLHTAATTPQINTVQHNTCSHSWLITQHHCCLHNTPQLPHLQDPNTAHNSNRNCCSCSSAFLTTPCDTDCRLPEHAQKTLL